MNECVIVYTGVILCCSCSLGAVVHVFLFTNEGVIVYSGVILCCTCSLGAKLHNIEWHLYRQLHTRSLVTTHVTRLLTSTSNIEWLLYRQLHTRSWETTHVTRLPTSTNNIEWHLYRQLHTRSWVTTHVTCHSMLFVFVRSQVTCVVTHERVCNCLYRCHSMFFVLIRSHVTCVLLMNEYVIVYTGVKTHVSRLLISTNNIEWHLYRQLHTRSWIKTSVPRLLNHEQHSSLGTKLHVFLFMNECVIVYSGVSLCCSWFRSSGTDVFTHERAPV
jgi:hypothetical protein